MKLCKLPVEKFKLNKGTEYRSPDYKGVCIIWKEINYSH